MLELEQLRLDHFRNFTHFEHRFTSPLTLVVGPNGSGKSNLLEAIYFLATGFSPRTRKDSEVITWGERFSRIGGRVGQHRLVVAIERLGKRVLVDGKQKNLREFVSHLKVVLFQPSDLSLLDGSPRGRRRFLDRLLSTLDFEYLHALGEYQKVLKQRNTLLGRERFDGEFWEVLTRQLVSEAQIIQEKRRRIIEDLNALLGSLGLLIEYQRSPRRGALEERFFQLKEKERAFGFTLIGPQRDDFRVKMRDLAFGDRDIDLGTFGSRGQQRMAVIRLKLAQLEIIKEKTGQEPLLLLDDLLSELDSLHQQKVFEVLFSQQTILTTAYLGDSFLKRLRNADTQVLKLG